MGSETPKAAVLTYARIVLWMIVSIAFLVQVGLRVHRDNAADKPVTNWVVAQGVLWSLVLCFWSYAAWRKWNSRNDARGVV